MKPVESARRKGPGVYLYRGTNLVRRHDHTGVWWAFGGPKPRGPYGHSSTKRDAMLSIDAWHERRGA